MWAVVEAHWLKNADSEIASLWVRDELSRKGYQRRDLWVPVVLRKYSHCMECHCRLVIGATAFRSMANYLFRMERICVQCMKRLCNG